MESPPRSWSRRRFLGASALAAGALALPRAAAARRTAELPPPDLPVAEGYRPHVASLWVPRGEQGEAWPRFVRAVEAVTDFGWLSKGDRVLLKLALNSHHPYPATTDPWLVWATVRLLQERGAGEVRVGDQSGVEHVLHTADEQVGSSRKCCEEAGLLEAIEAAGATPVFFEEAGYDAYRTTVPIGDHHWPAPIRITAALDQVDHVIYLARVSAHAVAGATLGQKLAVGFLREDSRRAFHRAGEHLPHMYEEINQVPEIRDRLRLVLSSATQVLCTVGPDIGYAKTPDHGLVLASTDLVAHDLLAFAWLRWNQKHLTPGLPRVGHELVAGLRSRIHRTWFKNTWPTGDEEVPDVPGFHHESPYTHPALANAMTRRGGRPETVQWEQVGPVPSGAPTAWMKAVLGV